jgi:hypothetical protein
LFGLPAFFQSFEHWLEPVFEPVNTIARDGAEHAGHAARNVPDGRLHRARARRHLRRALRLSQAARRSAPDGGLLYPVLYNKWYVDEIYDLVFVRGLSLGGGAVLRALRLRRRRRRRERHGVGHAFVSTVSMWWDTWIVDGLVNLSAFTVRALSFPVRFLQTGRLPVRRARRLDSLAGRNT